MTPYGGMLSPHAIRQACCLAHDGSRPSLALRIDGLRDLRVVDAGDVEMFSGDIVTALPALERAVAAVATSGVIPLVPAGDHSIARPDVRHAVANRVVLEALCDIARRRLHAATGECRNPAAPLLEGR